MNGTVGPYEVETWYDERREIVYIKMRRWLDISRAGTGPSKRGVLMKWSAEVLEQVMEDIYPAREYPEADWSRLTPEK